MKARRWMFFPAVLAFAFSSLGCAEKVPDPQLRLTISGDIQEAVFVRGTVRNVGSGTAAYRDECGTFMNFEVRDSSGRLIDLVDPCAITPMMPPCLGRESFLEPGESLEQSLTISGMWWPSDSCEVEALPPGIYTVSARFVYGSEGESNSPSQVAESTISFER
jgi:hypothetical protein